MNAVAEILASLKRAGISVSLDGRDLVVRPSSAVTPELASLLREHKGEIFEMMGTIASEEEAFELAREHFGLHPIRRARRRDRRGLIAKWSREFGYVAILDPLTGRWHSLTFRDAPEWAKWEARKRKELYKGGNRAAYELTAAEMEKIRKEEHPEEKGIVEEYPLE